MKTFAAWTLLFLTRCLLSGGTVIYCRDGNNLKGKGRTYEEKIVNNWDSAKYATTDLHKIAANFKRENKLKLTFETGRSNHPLVRQSRSIIRHGLVAAAVEAYNLHIGLELSPDDLWLAIIQGVADHLSQKENAEKHRKTFVSHEGQKKLCVDGEDHGLLPIPGLRESEVNVDPWEGIVGEFADKIKTYTKTDIADIFSSPFTTTNTLESTVFKASLMEAMQNYFYYEVYFLCGIPEIALLGTAADYRDIQARVKRLSTLLPDLDWWFVKIQKIVTKFLDAMEGEPDLDWWSGIVTVVNGCYHDLTGWLSDFFPYINGRSRENKTGGLDYTKIPYGLSYTPVTLEDRRYTMKTYNLRLVAGFVGVSTTCETKRIRPAIGWMVFYENYTNMEKHGDINNELCVLRSTSPHLSRRHQSEKLICTSDGQKIGEYKQNPKGGKRKNKHRRQERMKKIQRRCRRHRHMLKKNVKLRKRCSKLNL